jgi:6-pyruvoyltetrahydropterin/6-carboxytetrahydropterin synthase
MPKAPAGRYSVTVEASFSALHRLRLPDGTWEPRHGHDWRVRASFTRCELNGEGMVLDFHRAQAALQYVVMPLHHADLNDVPALAGLNPTAEVVARFLFDGLKAAGLKEVRSVCVTEAPGCEALYETLADA